MPGSQTEFTIVVPMRNESANAEFLLSAIEDACAGRSFEAVFIDDGSDDGTAETLENARKSMPWIRIVRHPVSAGQSAAIHSGVLAATSQVICTMDGDGQNPPSEVPRLVAPLLDGDNPPGLVAGQRVKRRDTLSKRFASRFANGLRRWLLKDGTRDTGCGLKAFRRQDFLALPYFNHMHRYLPALFNAQGHRVEFVSVSHQERHAGDSKYTNLQRAVVGLVDLFGVMWLIRRKKGVSAKDIGWPDDRKPASVDQHNQQG